jgi:hypothetical protein
LLPLGSVTVRMTQLAGTLCGDPSSMSRDVERRLVRVGRVSDPGRQAVSTLRSKKEIT